MAKSAISICNVALSSVGERPIRSFDEDNQRSRLCGNLYDFAVEFVLAQLDWPFARRYRILNEISDYEFDFETNLGDERVAYQLPSDCIKPLDLEPEGHFDKWEQVGNVLILVPFMDTITLKYTKKETNPSFFSASFSMLVSDFIVTRIAGPLTGAKPAAISNLVNTFNFNLTTLTVRDANTGSNSRNTDDEPTNDSFVME